MPTVNGVGKPGAGEPHARFDGRELETRHHRPWPPQWDNLPGNRGNTRLRDLPSIHVHAPAPDPTVWLYHRFPLSFREVEEMMLERGVVVSPETIRQWCAKFGQAYANALRRRRPRPGTRGTSMRCTSKSPARPTTCGGRWTSTATSWTFWSPPGGTPRPRPGSSASCSQRWSTCPGCWSRTNWAATRRRDARVGRSVEHRQSTYLQ